MGTRKKQSRQGKVRRLSKTSAVPTSSLDTVDADMPNFANLKSGLREIRRTGHMPKNVRRFTLRKSS